MENSVCPLQSHMILHAFYELTTSSSHDGEPIRAAFLEAGHVHWRVIHEVYIRTRHKSCPVTFPSSNAGRDSEGKILARRKSGNL